MYDTIISFNLKTTDDRNYDNHAYISNKSCSTAIESVLAACHEIKLMQIKNPKLCPFFLLEDAEGAFESIDHGTILMIIDKLFKNHK